MSHRRTRRFAPPAVAVAVALPFTALPAAAAAPPPALARATASDHAPVVTGFRLTPSTVRRGTVGRFRFVTSREGAASIALARITTTGRLRPAGRVRFAVDAGEGTQRFDGTLAGRRLPPGRYRATLTVTNAGGGPSVPRRLSFRIAA